MNNKVTVLITTYNRSQVLDKSLERLTNLTLPDEVLVIDDGGDRQADATEQVCRGFKDRLPIRYIYNNNPGVTICSFARNLGTKQAVGDIIITSEPESLWISDIVPQVLKKRSEFPSHIISVGTIYHMQENARLSDLVYIAPESFLNASIVEDYQIEPRPYTQTGFVKSINLTATYCAMYEREWLMQVGGWDESFPGNWGFDDHDLLTRLRLRGYNQVIDNEMSLINQWHVRQLPHIQGKNGQMNDEYWQSKNLNEVKTREDIRLIANQGKEWGVLKV